jgi:hypothetical protein
MGKQPATITNNNSLLQVVCTAFASEAFCLKRIAIKF